MMFGKYSIEKKIIKRNKNLQVNLMFFSTSKLVDNQVVLRVSFTCLQVPTLSSDLHTEGGVHLLCKHLCMCVSSVGCNPNCINRESKRRLGTRIIKSEKK